MNRKHLVLVVATLAAWLATSRPAAADITAFVGLSGGPSTRTAWGLAGGIGFVIVGVEFEYSDISESFADGAPSIRTGSLNLLVQTPMAVGGVQLYGTAGAGGYHQDLGTASETNASVNLGGGAKIKLLGPLRVRVDYRYFRFMGSPFGGENVHRVYVGGNLSF